MKKKTLAEIVAGQPVNKSTALVTGPGQHYDPQIVLNQFHSENPPPVRRIPKTARDLPDLVGKKFGHLSVVGLARDHNSVWVVRCDCGSYEYRRTRSIQNPNNQWDRCMKCRHLLYQRKRDIWRRTGITPDERFDSSL